MVRARDARPLRMLRDLFRWQPRDLVSLTTWDPFEEMAPLLNGMAMTVFSPAFEVKEVKNAYLFKANVPGVKESDIVADPSFAPMYGTRGRRIKTEKRDARALADACMSVTYRDSSRFIFASRRLGDRPSTTPRVYGR